MHFLTSVFLFVSFSPSCPLSQVNRHVSSKNLKKEGGLWASDLVGGTSRLLYGAELITISLENERSGQVWTKSYF